MTEPAPLQVARDRSRAPQAGRPDSVRRSRHIAALTGLRGYAALWVVVSHVSYTDQFFWPLAARLHWRRLDGLIRHEYLAVDLFFMLSGFVLTHVHWAEFKSQIDRRAYARFLLLRLARIYPLHLSGLLLTLAAWALAYPAVSADDTPFSFACHVFLVASWGFTPAVTWNLPAWSLSSEWMAYLAFPALALATAALRGVRAQAVAVAVLCGCFYGLMFCSPQHLDYSTGSGAALRVLVGAALGSLLYRLHAAPFSRTVPWTSLFWLGLPLAALTMTTLDGARRPDSIWAWLAMPALLFCAAHARGRWMLPLTSQLAVYLGEISFAVYMLHHPVLRLVRLMFRPQLERAASTAPDAVVFAIFFALMLAIVLVAALAHACLELPVRNWARRRIDDL